MADHSNVREWLHTRVDEVEVLNRFIYRMQQELARNTGKGDRAGWMQDTPRSLLAEIQHHYVKLHAAVVELDRGENGEAIRKLPWLAGGPFTEADVRDLVAEFAADVANMAMMVADRCGALQEADRG